MHVWMYLQRKGAYRDFLHIIAHTISNKLVSKVFAQKKGGGESYDSYKFCSDFGGFTCVPRLRPGIFHREPVSKKMATQH